ncbi:MAG: 4-hydroxy-tetrahydrodipicolinate reductase [Acidimicrobiia bacterium]|nr:4-hydroxy-tetrahydrodipicolinate reductase [Acidimicrobiia bacterium]
MGSLASTTLLESDDLHLIALYDAYTAGSIGGIPISQSRDTLDGCDVVVEFSRPEVVMDNLDAWRRFGANVVVGTSGFDADRIEELRELWGNGPGNCLVVPNFSIGAVLMMKIAELVAPHYPAAEIIELHHDRKADAPSGTSIATARRIADAAEGQRRRVDSEEIVDGALGAVVDGVRVHAVRLPGLVAHQRVVFGGDGEVLTVSHDTIDRSSFMPGMLLAVRSIRDQKEPVAVGLEPLLGL